MKRDQDLLWAILAVLEASAQGYEHAEAIGDVLAKTRPEQTVDAIKHHLSLLGDKGFAVAHGHGYWRITNAGHDAHATNPDHVTQTFAKLGQ